MPKDDILSKVCTREDIDWQLAALTIPADPRRPSVQAGLKRRLTSLPILRLGLAVDLPRPSVERICAWARINVHPEVILDIAVDPKLVAGAQISWRGKYCDYAKRDELERLLSQFKI